MATGMLSDLTDEEKRKLNEMLSRSTIESHGDMGYLNGEGNLPLSRLMDGPQPLAQNQSYGQLIQPQQAGPITDPTRGYVDTPYGRGMYMKADPLKVVLGDNRIVDLGRDTTAERARTKENLGLDAQRAQIAETQAKTRALGVKPTEPEALRTIKGAMEIYKSLPDGDMKRAFGEKHGLETKGVDDKPLPISTAKGLLENQQNLRRAQQALALIKGNNVGAAVGDENATGWKGYAPDSVLQRMDPGGVDTRAAIGDIGSLVIHQRSGAAVTASEFPRLRPFIPQHTDSPETVRKKLGRFVQEYQNIASETADFYKESGFKVPTETLKSAGAPATPGISVPPSAAEYLKANPALRGAFDAKYGAGASAQILGK